MMSDAVGKDFRSGKGHFGSRSRGVRKVGLGVRDLRFMNECDGTFNGRSVSFLRLWSLTNSIHLPSNVLLNSIRAKANYFSDAQFSQVTTRDQVDFLAVFILIEVPNSGPQKRRAFGSMLRKEVGLSKLNISTIDNYSQLYLCLDLSWRGRLK
jgi:hypothetical protein